MVGTPAAEVEVDASLVSQLLAEQHPDLKDLGIQFVDAGWDNSIFRLGDRLAARLPQKSDRSKTLRTGATLVATTGKAIAYHNSSTS